MNITFFIGNGFDLNLGLKTSYVDFYQYFIDHASEENMISNWLEEENLQWSDLEEELGKHLSKVKEKDAEKFIQDKGEMNGLLSDYLEHEQMRFLTQGKEEAIAEEFARSLIEFAHGLSAGDQDSLLNTCNAFAGETFRYCFISFNYTDILNQIVEITKKRKKIITTHKNRGNLVNNILGDILYIHGTTNTEMVLAVNDTSQINNPFLKDNEDFLDIFIKKNIDDALNQGKIEQAKKMIYGSHIICIFGMSLGNTDKMWWEELIIWLKKSESNKLVLYIRGYEKELKKRLPEKTIPLGKQIKRSILEKGGISLDDPSYRKLTERIMISFNADIFKFDRLPSE